MYNPILHNNEYLTQYYTTTNIQANTTQPPIYMQVLQDNQYISECYTTTNI